MTEKNPPQDRGSGPWLEPDRPIPEIEGASENGLTIIRGYVGQGRTDRGRVRIYRTLELTSYWEIKSEDIVHRQRLDSEEQPLAGSILWVKPDAEIGFKEVQTGTLRADFLRGPITGAAQTSISNFGIIPPAPRTTWVCVGTVVITLTIFDAPSGGENSDKCCNTGGCSATSKCLCSGGGQNGPSCNVC